jgi:TPP-dependent indolepyruvate ferredoxin oxidoreductase alpha subunit
MSAYFFVLLCCVLKCWIEFDSDLSFLHISTITDNMTNAMTGKQTPKTMAVVSLPARFCTSGVRFELVEVCRVVELEDVAEVGSMNDEFKELFEE